MRKKAKKLRYFNFIFRFYLKYSESNINSKGKIEKETKKFKSKQKITGLWECSRFELAMKYWVL